MAKAPHRKHVERIPATDYVTSEEIQAALWCLSKIHTLTPLTIVLLGNGEMEVSGGGIDSVTLVFK